MELGVNEIISLLVVFISLLFAIFLLAIKSENYTSNLIIALYLIMNAQDSDSIFISSFVYPHLPGLGMFLNSTVMLKMPLIYLYVLSVIYSDFRFRPIHLLHAIPWLIVIVVFIPNYYAVSYDEKWAYLELNQTQKRPEVTFSYVLVHIQIVVYLIASFVVVARYRKLLLQNYSNASLFNYRFLFQFLVVLAISDLVASLKNVLLFARAENAYFYSLLVTSILVLGFICWMVLKALLSPELFRGINSHLQIVRNRPRPSISPSGMNEETRETYPEEIQELIYRLKSFMKDHEPYLDPSITMYDLSKKLEMPAKELSLLINQHLNQHFFDFINEYRINKAREILQDPSNESATVLEILYDVGFNSKSSFNTAFKKYTHLTPTEYRKKYLKSAS